MDKLKVIAGSLIAIFMIEAILSPAWAIDFTPLAVQGLDILQMAALVLGGILTKFAVSWLSTATGLKNAEMERVLADQANAILNRAISMAYAAALAKVNDPNSPIKKVEFDNVFINMAVNYALTSMPGIIAKFGLTEQRIRDMIIARLPDWMHGEATLTASDVVIAEANAKKVADAAA
jgi:hypothetical protein